MTEYEIKRLCDRVKELWNEKHLLGERCNQLLKDKGDLTDHIADLKANCDLAIEGRDIKIRELEQQIEKMKCCGNCEHFDFNEPNYCHKGVYRERQYVCSEWEFGN